MSGTALFIFIAVLLLNYIFYKKKYINKSIFLISSIFVTIYFITNIIIYYNNISNGYEYGILFGDILNNHFCDEYRYFKDSEILENHLKNGQFMEWIKFNLPHHEYTDPQGHPGFGNYNLFVIFLAFLRLLGLNTVLELITIKCIFYLITAIFIYKLARLYLSEKFSLLVLIIFSILPGYLLTNSLLMRDNIIILLTLIILYYILNQKYNLFIFIPSLIILFLLRAYLVPVIFVAYIFALKNNKKIISYWDVLFFIIIYGAILFFSNFNFHSDQMRILQERLGGSFGYGLLQPLKIIWNSLINIFIVPPYINFLISGNIYLMIFSLGNIISVIIGGIFILKFIYLMFKSKSEKVIFLLRYTFYFTFLIGIIVFSKDGYIINRIALMWFLLFVIILFISKGDREEVFYTNN